MRSIRKYIAGVLSAAMIMTSAFAQGGMVSYAEEQDAVIEATASDAEAYGVQADGVDLAPEIGLEADIEENEIAEGELEAQGDSGVTDSGLKYSVSDNDEITITGYSGTATEVDIPSEIDGKKVISIGEDAFREFSIGDEEFRDFSGLTSIKIPDSVTTIGNNAFRGCSSLTDIKIPDSVTSIGFYAFRGCIGLTGISIPKSVTSIDGSAFEDCSGLENITVEYGNTTYDSRNNCNAIIEISSNTLIIGCKNTIIPDDVTAIGALSFSGCSGLINITIPNSVTSIGHDAFLGCTGLMVLSIPKSVTSIDYSTFVDCSGLNSIIVEDGNTAYDSRNNCNAIIETSTDLLIIGCKNTIIPKGVTGVCSYAFRNCSGLTSISIPEGVTGIGFGAFENCSGLISVSIPSSVEAIGSRAFKGCSSLTGVSILGSTMDMGYWVFNDCNELTITCKKGSTAHQYALSNNIPCNILAEKITINPSAKTIANGKSVTLKADVSPSEATDKTVTWKSNNTKVATVDKKTGKVTAVAKGTATITCTAADGSGVTATCKITVTTPVSKVALNTTSKTIAKGKSTTLKATVTPAKAYQKVTWKSSNESVATVTSSGKVTAKKEGTVTITCTAADGTGKKVTCKITVKTPATKIKLSKTTASLKVGKTITLKATVTPGKAYQKVTWKSSNTKVATVSPSGKVTARKKGTATITCTAADGSSKKATCKITVK
jgi:uncharacterized protein YjdB